MANLTSKELSALEDQLGFEKVCGAGVHGAGSEDLLPAVCGKAQAEL